MYQIWCFCTNLHIHSPNSLDYTGDQQQQGLMPVHGNCMVAPLPRHACETPDVDRAWPPALLISSATGRSTPAMDTDDVTARSWLVILTIRASDLSGFSCRPFCRYRCLTSVVHSARTDSPVGVLSTHTARWSCVSSACWCYCTPWWAMTSAVRVQYTVSQKNKTLDFLS